MKPMQVFEKMQKLETHEEMTTFLQSLPKKDEPWSDDPGEPASPAVTSIREKQPTLKRKPYDGKHSVADGDMPEPNVQLAIYCAENADSVGGGAAALGEDGKWYWTQDCKLSEVCKYTVTHWVYL